MFVECVKKELIQQQQQQIIGALIMINYANNVRQKNFRD